MRDDRLIVKTNFLRYGKKSFENSLKGFNIRLVAAEINNNKSFH